MRAAACWLAVVVALAASASSAAAEWTMDTAASRLEFVATFERAPAPGVFKTFDTHVRFDGQHPADSRIDVTIMVASADMANADVNREIRGPDWFDAARFPQAQFRSTGVRPAGANRFVATGTLGVKGVERPIELPFTWSESGNVATMEGELTLERATFNIGLHEWARTDVIGPDVKVKFKLRLRKDA